MQQTKVPFDITFHPGWWHKNAGIDFDAPFLFDMDYRLESDVAMRRVLHEKFGRWGLGEARPQKRPILWTDLLASGFLFSAMSGCGIRFAKDAPPEVVCAAMPLAQAAALRAEDALQTEWWQAMLAQAEALRRTYGEVLCCINLQGVQNLALDLRGEDLFFDYYDEPEQAQALLSYCCDLLIQASRQLKGYSPQISAGVTAIIKQVFPEGFVHSDCTADMVSADCFDAFLLPYELRLAQALAPYGIHHCGAHMERLAGSYAKIPGLAFAEVGAGSDVAAVCRQLPEQVHLSLRVSPVMLQTATQEEIERTVRRLVADCGGRGNLSMSCVGIDADTPEDSIACLLEAMRTT